VGWRYSELHNLRGELIRATILALDALSAAHPQWRPERIDDIPSRMDRLRTELRLAFDAEPDTVEWMLAADRPAPQPNYGALPLDIPCGLPEVLLNSLSGLNWFVNHSDCDGFHMAHPNKSATQQRKKIPRMSEWLLAMFVSVV
jgi:hypothetical protein